MTPLHLFLVSASHVIISMKGRGKCDPTSNPRNWEKNLITDICSENWGPLLRAGKWMDPASKGEAAPRLASRAGRRAWGST